MPNVRPCTSAGERRSNKPTGQPVVVKEIRVYGCAQNFNEITDNNCKTNLQGLVRRFPHESSSNGWQINHQAA